MKNFGVIFLILVSLSCEEHAQEKIFEPSAGNIVGSWQLVEAYISPGGDTSWQKVENGDIYNFHVDGTFSQVNTFNNAYDRSGSFTYDDDGLKLVFTVASEEKWQSFHVEMADNSMTLTPSGPTLCIEACLYRYKKIK